MKDAYCFCNFVPCFPIILADKKNQMGVSYTNFEKLLSANIIGKQGTKLRNNL